MNQPKPTTLLTESDLARIILKLPSISDRARIWGHIAAVKYHTNSHAASDDTASTICDWIERTWPEHTVRAKMARKVSGLIRSGQWKT
tara:strand:- start:7554 stop:7817 length:264 start_codon:yes stop_codon:yes gene_type:complete